MMEQQRLLYEALQINFHRRFSTTSVEQLDNPVRGTPNSLMHSNLIANTLKRRRGEKGTRSR